MKVYPRHESVSPRKKLPGHSGSYGALLYGPSLREESEVGDEQDKVLPCAVCGTIYPKEFLMTSEI